MCAMIEMRSEKLRNFGLFDCRFILKCYIFSHLEQTVDRVIRQATMQYSYKHAFAKKKRRKKNCKNKKKYENVSAEGLKKNVECNYIERQNRHASPKRKRPHHCNVHVDPYWMVHNVTIPTRGKNAGRKKTNKQ